MPWIIREVYDSWVSPLFRMPAKKRVPVQHSIAITSSLLPFQRLRLPIYQNHSSDYINERRSWCKVCFGRKRSEHQSCTRYKVDLQWAELLMRCHSIRHWITKKEAIHNMSFLKRTSFKTCFTSKIGSWIFSFAQILIPGSYTVHSNDKCSDDWGMQGQHVLVTVRYWAYTKHCSVRQTWLQVSWFMSWTRISDTWQYIQWWLSRLHQEESDWLWLLFIY